MSENHWGKLSSTIFSVEDAKKTLLQFSDAVGKNPEEVLGSLRQDKLPNDLGKVRGSRKFSLTIDENGDICGQRPSSEELTSLKALYEKTAQMIGNRGYCVTIQSHSAEGLHSMDILITPPKRTKPRSGRGGSPAGSPVETGFQPT